MAIDQTEVFPRITSQLVMDDVRQFTSFVIGFVVGVILLTMLKSILPEEGVFAGIFKLLIMGFSITLIAFIVENFHRRILRKRKQKDLRKEIIRQAHIQQNLIRLQKLYQSFSDQDLLELYAQYSAAGYYDTKLVLIRLFSEVPSFRELRSLEEEIITRNLIDPEFINNKLEDLKHSLNISNYI
jgi:hypothetical protein